MSFSDVCERLKDMVEPLSASEQRAIFHDNAQRYYRIDIQPNQNEVQ
jgi:predicted TIM-barrel fold metal-dependent hydrolase